MDSSSSAPEIKGGSKTIQAGKIGEYHTMCFVFAIATMKAVCHRECIIPFWGRILNLDLDPFDFSRFRFGNK
eukprot:scaffold1119_cov120-Cylindrotheca_fusiformis.AAC.12